MTIPTILIVALFGVTLQAQESFQLSGRVTNEKNNAPLQGASIFIEETGELKESDENGYFQFENIGKGVYILQIFKENFVSQTQETNIGGNVETNVALVPLGFVIEGAEVTGHKSYGGLASMRNVENFGIYGGKKSEVIALGNVQGNVAANNAREIFKGISGLNIHENDAAGLQLSIGARGLDPNRTANFNTRQNGYDISADALGYPESYYTPPVQGLRKIEIVRGAASLQYGTQFGGLLNFVFKDGPKHKPFSFTTENTYGSNRFFSTFNTIGGTYKKMNYFAFYNYKRGDGFRPSSGFGQHSAYAKIKWSKSRKWKIQLEYTFMDYLSQQPGGLQDFEFGQNPYQSNRQRNWFKVNWNLSALEATYFFNGKSRINFRNFYLDAGREALGELAPINRPDPLGERDLVQGEYHNFGNETRFVHQYKIGGRLATFLIGTRYYQGKTKTRQGDAPDGSGADFNFTTGAPNASAYRFPSRNAAVFAEHLFQVGTRFSITPGLRWEYIRTAADGYLYQRVFSGGEMVFEDKIMDERENNRQIFLAGLGLSYRMREELEWYANFSQNYRSINFSDLTLQNPNMIVDSLLQDEKGYNFDLGARGQLLKNKVRFDATLFALRYNNRIGIKDVVVTDEIGIQRAVDYRTNIGDAIIFGLESYIESDLVSLFKKESDFKLLAFSNLSVLGGVYVSGGSDIKGNEVELIPPLSWKTGLDFRWGELKTAIQYSFVARHYSDATNAELVANATRGLIPRYQILDFSMGYQWKSMGFSAGVNNVMGERYFTRRTASYPGPGIIPAQGRNFYVGLKMGF